MDDVKSIPIENIVVTEDNPRQRFDEDPLRSLGESIKTHGLLQPIVVRPRKGYYELVVGERRLKAARLVGLREIDAKILDLDDATCMELRLIENTHREDLTEAEKGDAVLSLMEKYPYKYPTIASVAEAINMAPYSPQRWVAHATRLSEKVKMLIDTGRLSDRQARHLLKYDHTTQDKLSEVIVRKNVSTTRVPDFTGRYDVNPKADLDDLADEVMGIRKVEVALERLRPETRKEVEEIIEEKKKLVKEARQRFVKARKFHKRRVRKKVGRQLEAKRPTVSEPQVTPPELDVEEISLPEPEAQMIPEIPETRGVSVAVFMPTDIFSKVTGLAGELRMQLGETIVYCTEKFFEWREK